MGHNLHRRQPFLSATIIVIADRLKWPDFNAQNDELTMTARTKKKPLVRKPSRPKAKERPQKTKATAPVAGGKPENIPRIGVRLRHARALLGLSLREVAERVGVTESFVSKVENNRVRPSLATLHKMVTVLQTNIGVLFADSENDSEQIMLIRQGKRPVIRVLGAAQRQGIRLERLIPARSDNLLQANIHVVPSGEGTDELISHSGQEFGFVLEGDVDLIVAGERYELSQGDAFVFESALPHGYRNRSRRVARIIWVNTPPTF
jgi:transcriptional regulator with XRE-family HTH domain